MWKRIGSIVLFLILIASLARVEPQYFRIVVLGDPHLPYSTERFTDPVKEDQAIAAKIKVRDDINGWDDVSLVAVVGDLVAETGTEEEYKIVRSYFEYLSKPLAPVTGNHDFRYEDHRNAAGRLIRGDAESRRLKMQRFRDTFGLASLSYTKEKGPYLLVFLSAEMESDSSYLLQYSGKQLQWLRGELEKHKEKPTLIFTHSPLKDTLTAYNGYANSPNFYAQPHEELRQLLAHFPQVFLWVSGHTHTPPTNANYNAEINLYDGRIWNIHNADMDRETIWSNSLYLYTDRVVIRTFNHRKGQWMDELERVLPVPLK